MASNKQRDEAGEPGGVAGSSELDEDVSAIEQMGRLRRSNARPGY